jgi:hypothetical protein
MSTRMFVNGKSLMMSAAVSERPAKWSLTPSRFSIIAPSEGDVLAHLRPYR